jgi:glyoxylase-like metal-dependent hydrolase (beta-lactamase superfamily II)/ferredoxin
MATLTKRVPENTPGDFFVDSTCIDCDQCREIAPATFGDGDGTARVYRQPLSASDVRQALSALLTCPVGAIGTQQRHDIQPALDRLPILIEDNVYFCGFASSRSFGGSSYLIVRPEGNVLVDSPRFAGRLVRRLEQMGGVRQMFLSHIDDIADHAKFQKHFGCERIIHRSEVRPSISAIETQISGVDPIPLATDLLAIPTPGHTRGHTVLLYRDKFLFTGDHLWWSPERERLSASKSYCWYSWDDQIESMERLLNYRFEWVLPGHGWRHHASADQMQRMLKQCVLHMKRG